MNIQEYISSGIVESYVLGLADSQERAEFERMCAAHTEIREARESFEISLEKQAMRNALHPSKNLKSKIFAQIDIENDESGIEGRGFQNISTAEHRAVTGQAVASRMQWQRYLAAASVVLLLASTALNFYFFSRYREYNSRYEALLSSQQQLASGNEVLQARLREYETSMGILKDPAMAIVKMPAVPTGPDPSSATTIYWNTNSKDVYLVVNQLPAPSPGQQYQLWALVDGVPVDAGVFDVSAATGLMKMKNIPKAQAFAITLEKQGGSPTPNMEKLYVMGKV